MAGLYIHRKSGFRPLRWLIVLTVLGLFGAGGYYGYTVYTQGAPDTLPVSLPAVVISGPELDETPVSQSDIDSYTVPDAAPAFISIPSIGLDKARVTTVNLNKSRTLDMPGNLFDAGWYKDSGEPGQGFGAVVLAGNSFSTTSSATKGVFGGLGGLKLGDKISLTRGDGKVFTYTVKQVDTVNYADFLHNGMQNLVTPLDEDREGLSLLTYDGKWIPRDKHFERQIIIRAIADFGEDDLSR